mmetsp:Transcript_58612/g.79940  ORF Transcript_58612/g.79940 Transcript_58612/m.79940 type:complete len:249 (-) Transcript_58612:154-900(-)
MAALHNGEPDPWKHLRYDAAELLREWSEEENSPPKVISAANGLNDRDRFGELLERAGVKGRGAIVGVEYGDMAEQVLLGWTSCDRLLLVDPFTESPDRLDFVHGVVKRWLQSGVARFINSPPSEAASQIEDGSLAFVYMETPSGDDSESVRELITTWWPKLRSGGMLAGHDYTRAHQGVTRAANDWAKEQGAKLYLTDVQSVRRDARDNLIPPCCPSWYMFKSAGTDTPEEDIEQSMVSHVQFINDNP